MTAEEVDFFFPSLRFLHSHWLFSGVSDSFQIFTMLDIWETAWHGISEPLVLRLCTIHTYHSNDD